MSAHIIGLPSLKGGVGKTTTAYHLARAAHLAKKKTLVIDADPQGNITTVLAEEALEPGTAGLADALSNHPGASDIGLADVIIPTVWDNVSLAPTSGSSLTAVREELSSTAIARERRLGSVLQPILDDYDLVIIDCPPSLDMLTINVLAAANSVLVVTEASMYGLDGVGLTRSAINEIRAAYNPDLLVHGVLVNRYNPQSVSERARVQELRAALTDSEYAVLEPLIPARVAIPRAADGGVGLDEWSAESAPLGRLYDRHMKSLLSTIRSSKN